MARYRVGEFVGGLHYRGYDTLMNINNPTTFSAPDLTYTTSNSSGTAGALRADDSVAIFSTTAPVAISTSTVSSATGDNPFASREDHVHGSTGIVAAASVAEMKAASSTTVFVTPGRAQNHPGCAKGWVEINGVTQAVRVSYNVTSTSDEGVGQCEITWATDFSGNDYAIAGIAGDSRYLSVSGNTDNWISTQTIIQQTNESGAAAEATSASIVVYGDQ